jgi:hypothetical protein
VRDSGASPSLRLRDLGVAASELACDPLTGRVTGCTEGGRYEITADWPLPCRLLVDEVEVSVIGTKRNCWQWEAGFYAGEVAAELMDATGVRLGCYRIDVSPHAGKLGRERFDYMVEELSAFDRRLVLGYEASRTSIGTGGAVTNPHLEYARLRLHGERFLAAMRQLGQRPQLQLFHRREHRPAHKVRRLDLATIRTAFRNAGALSVLAGHGDGDLAPDTLFDVPTTHEGVDTPANRVMLGVLQAVRRRSRAVLAALEDRAAAGMAGAERDALLARMPTRRAFLTSLVAGLDKVQARRPFDAVTRSEISAAGLNAVSAHPLYARAYRAGWAVLRAGIAGVAPDESLWMSPTWAIFERWCFVATASALERLFPNATWERRFPSMREDCILFRGTDGSRQIDIHLQPRFPAFDQASSQNFASISGERYPDIVVTVEYDGTEQFLVLDAKYRVTRPNVLDAMVSAHLYRDSLRWHGRPPSACLLLTPAGGGAPWLEDPQFWDAHGVGVAVVEQGKAREQILQVLRRLLKS